MTKLAASLLAVLFVFSAALAQLPLAGDATQQPAHAESQPCPLNEANDGANVTLKGRTIQEPHDLGFAVDGCAEHVMLTYAGASDNSVPLDRLRQDKNLTRFKKFTQSTYPGTKTHPCNQCAMYGDTEATLIGQLQLIGKGVTRNQIGNLQDANGKRIWKPGFGNPVPYFIYRLVITSVEGASAQKLPPPEL